MSFWRDLNKGFNKVVGAVGQVAGASGIPILSQAGNLTSAIIQSGQSQPTFVPDAGYDAGYVQGNVQFGDGRGSATSNNTLLYIVGGVALFLILKKK